jgi:MATE family multidrug resistance protein
MCSSLFGLLGTLRGCGLQKIGAIVMIGTLYIIGIPLSVVLGFPVHLRSKVLYTILQLKFFTREVHEL